MLGRMDEHLGRLLQDVETAVRHAQPTETSVVWAGRTVEAIWKAMDGAVPIAIRERVREFAYELERIGFRSDASELAGLVKSTFERYEEDLRGLTTSNL
jgi:hypothetical protein